MRYVSAMAFRERHEKGNATLFEKIRGYYIPLVVNAISGARMVALALETDEKNVQREYGKRVSHLVKPRLVKDGPVKEVVLVGNDVDLTRFPIPLQHADDGAPYISAGITVSKNPDTGEYEIKYAVILHEKENFMGKAAIFDQDQNVCLNLGSVVALNSSPNRFSRSSNLIGISSCEAATCFDTDEGQVWDIYGECREDEELKFWDTCIGDVLYESYCDGSECKQTAYDCLAGGYDYCQDGACHSGTPPSDCDDTDEGQIWDERGSCYEDGTWVATDECESSTNLKEWYCDGVECKNVIHDCSPYGCDDGECTTEAPTCEDTDGGKDFTIKGSCYENEVLQGTDSCIDDTFLEEWYCAGADCTYTTRNCSPGNCEDGKCSGAPPPPPGGGYGADLSGTVSSITVYLKPVGEPIGQGVKFWGDKNYTKEKDDVETVYYGDGGTVADLESIDANNKITSMEMDGHYVALLFDKENYQGDCEVFMASCPDFRSHRIGQCGWLGRSDCLSSFIVKARK